MKTSENGISFIKDNEGFRSRPYMDTGQWAWGYGHDRQDSEVIPMSISEEDADALLRSDLATRFEPAVSRMAPQANQNQYDALVDFCYNLGPVALATMLAHGFNQVPANLPHWCYVSRHGVEMGDAGLLARREKEVALFLKPK